MADDRNELNSPDSPNVDAANTPDGDQDRKRAIKDRTRADDLAIKMSTADELSAYEKVAGRGLPD